MPWHGSIRARLHRPGMVEYVAQIKEDAIAKSPSAGESLVVETNAQTVARLERELVRARELAHDRLLLLTDMG
jgi:hypothetical protein